MVPRGFAAYARIFHRPLVSWAEGRPHPSQEELRESDPETWPEIFSAETTWGEAARAFGTEFHGTAQWNRIVRRGDGDPSERDWDHVIGPDGREYTAPEEGRLDAAQLTALASHLSLHTKTPDELFIALWSGWGGVLGFYGEAPARISFAASTDDGKDEGEAAVLRRHREMLERSIHDPFNNVFRRPVWQAGMLPDEVSQGPMLQLPQREHVLFTGSIDELKSPAWPGSAPWADPRADRFGLPIESPSLVWPVDRSWVVVTEVDFDSTIVAGSAELVHAICADAGIEALTIREGDDLAWDADEVNR